MRISCADEHDEDIAIATVRVPDYNAEPTLCKGPDVPSTNMMFDRTFSTLAQISDLKLIYNFTHPCCIFGNEIL